MRKIIYAMMAIAAVVVMTAASKKPVTLFMVGDSTMADKEELEASPERGWGQLFPTYLQGNIILQNHARNGRSTKSFLDQGRWQEVMNRAHKKDIVIIQFGHNDAKQSDTTRYASIEQYEDNLMLMIGQAQKKGMRVILCTPIARRYFNAEGQFYPAHGGYPEAARRVARRMQVPMLDMEAATNEWLRGLGPEDSKAYFMNVAPGECTKFPEGKKDNTHLRENGALAVGHMAAEMIKDMNLKWFKNYIVIPENPEPVYSTPCDIEK